MNGSHRHIGHFVSAFTHFLQLQRCLQGRNKMVQFSSMHTLHVKSVAGDGSPNIVTSSKNSSGVFSAMCIRL
jgi:hypothetical protein